MSEEGVRRRLLDLAELGSHRVDLLDLADLMLREAELREDNDARNRIRDEVNGWLAEWELRRPPSLGDLLASLGELLAGVEVELSAAERQGERLRAAWPNHVEAASLLEITPEQLSQATPPDGAGVPQDNSGQHYPPEVFLRLALQQGQSPDRAIAGYRHLVEERLRGAEELLGAALDEIDAAIEALRREQEDRKGP